MAASNPVTLWVAGSSMEKTWAVLEPPIRSFPAFLTADAQVEAATASSAARGPELMSAV